MNKDEKEMLAFVVDILIDICLSNGRNITIEDIKKLYDILGYLKGENDGQF